MSEFRMRLLLRLKHAISTDRPVWGVATRTGFFVILCFSNNR